MATFVLVHGAWHGGWCWQPVADHLRAQGHAVHAPTLTGLCDRAEQLTPEVGLDTHVDDVAGLLEGEDLTDAVLCGHSYGGMVVAGAAERAPARIAALVYLDAFVPAPGGSLFDHIPPERAAAFREAARERGEGWRVPPPDASIWAEDAALRASINARTTPHPLRSMTDRLPETEHRAGIARRHFAYAADNPIPTFRAFYDRLRDDPAWRVHVLPTSHDAMLSLPEAVAELLTAAAEA